MNVEEKQGHIPYWAYEGSLTRADMANKRLWVLCIILVLLLMITNVGWIMYESQFQVTETTTIEAEQEADGNGRNYVIGGAYGDKAEGQGD